MFETRNFIGVNETTKEMSLKGVYMHWLWSVITIKAKKIDIYVIHAGMVDFSVTPLGCGNLSNSHMINLILHNK